MPSLFQPRLKVLRVGFLLLKTNYQAVKNWLQTPKAESVIGKRVNWITIDTYGHGYLAILEQILEIIAKSS